MKKHSLRRCLAAVAAITIMASAMPAVPFSSIAAGNLISNSDFSSGVKGWGTYKETGGKCTLSGDSGRLALTVSNVGEKNYSVQFFYDDIIPLYQNGVYRLKYDISCTTTRYVESMIQQNGGTYQAYTWKGLTISPTVQSVDETFTMKKDTDIMAKLCFNCGNQEADENLPEHTIYLDNVSLELIDDSNVNYTTNTKTEASIITNQVGYRSDASKMVVVRGGNSSEFKVVNDTDKSVAFKGSLSAPIKNASADETDQIGDFSSVRTPGSYHIEVDGLDNSYSFVIRDKVYDGLLDDTVKMLYLQRCGTQVKDDTFGHGACHATKAKIYGTNDTIDVSGGWHDAGDYGRYVVPGAKAVADILYAYIDNPGLFGDSIGIAESGNGTADVLDEARFELEWMLKMQRNDGGVYHKVSCATFPGFVMPEEETDELIVTPVSTPATADFAASMALAYECYKDVDSSFANKCLAAAEKAWSFLSDNPNFIFTNPSDIVTGDYGDFFKNDKDERYWAACQLYRATGENKYLSAAESIGAKTGFGWSDMGDYGNLAILTMKDADKNSDVYKAALSGIITQADSLLETVSANPYGSSLTKYDWGSNMNIADNGIVLNLAYRLTGKFKYKDAAERQLDYLLGVNPLGTCFVTGWGTVSPEHPHHRPSVAKNKAMPGMVVGGVDQSIEDDAAKAYCTDLPAAKRWVDNDGSYSTNEITIYWNSPLTYLIALTADSSGIIQVDPPTGIVWGDANLDGNVTVADSVAILQYLGNKDKYNLDDKAKINADVYNNGDGITGRDALSIQKLDAGIISKLPESYMNSDFPVTRPVESVTTTTTQTTTTAQPTTTTTTQPSQPGGIPDKGTPMDKSATMISDFRTGDAGDFFASSGWTNGKPFDCWWYKQNAQIKGDHLELSVDKKWTNDSNPDWNPQYSGGEFRTNDFYHYGYYETSMQAMKNDGVVSSFFTYTGPTDIVNGQKNPWDEIDIEILGKDTTKVQLNYYTNGVGKHEKMIDLGFDSSLEYHTYGFDWQPNYIAWYIDGKEVYRATDNIPKTPGKIMMNAWPGLTVDDWLNHYDGKTPLVARYQWVTYKKK